MWSLDFTWKFTVAIFIAFDSCDFCCVVKTVDVNIIGVSNDVVRLIGICDEEVVTDMIGVAVVADVVNVSGLIEISDVVFVKADVSVDVIKLIGCFDVVDNSIDFVGNCVSSESVVDSEFTVSSINSSVNVVAICDVNLNVDKLFSSTLIVLSSKDISFNVTILFFLPLFWVVSCTGDSIDSWFDDDVITETIDSVKSIIDSVGCFVERVISDVVCASVITGVSVDVIEVVKFTEFADDSIGSVEVSSDRTASVEALKLIDCFDEGLVIGSIETSSEVNGSVDCSEEEMVIDSDEKELIELVDNSIESVEVTSHVTNNEEVMELIGSSDEGLVTDCDGVIVDDSVKTVEVSSEVTVLVEVMELMGSSDEELVTDCDGITVDD